MKKAAIAFTLMTAGLVVLGFLAPRDGIFSGCLFCGRTRDESWWLGIKFKDSISENECSKWVDGFHQNHTNHIWMTSTRQHKQWFGGTVIGCGGLGGSVANIHYHCKTLRQDDARAILDLYHWQVMTNRDHLREFMFQQFQSENKAATNTTATERASEKYGN
jgi:hypothetical protein